MKYIFAAAAAVAAKNHGIDALLDAPAKCELENKDQKPTLEALRLFAGEGMREFSRGFYGEGHDIIGEECFGEWMAEEWNGNARKIDQIVRDPLAVSLSDFQALFESYANIFFKPLDDCKIREQTDMVKNWCLDNKGQCTYWYGIEDRIIDNALTIVTDNIAFVHAFFEDDECYTTA